MILLSIGGASGYHVDLICHRRLRPITDIGDEVHVTLVRTGVHSGALGRFRCSSSVARSYGVVRQAVGRFEDSRTSDPICSGGCAVLAASPEFFRASPWFTGKNLYSQGFLRLVRLCVRGSVGAP